MAHQIRQVGNHRVGAVRDELIGLPDPVFDERCVLALGPRHEVGVEHLLPCGGITRAGSVSTPSSICCGGANAPMSAVCTLTVAAAEDPPRFRLAYFRFVDAVTSVVAIENVSAAIDQIAQTMLRKVVGQHTTTRYRTKPTSSTPTCLSLGALDAQPV